MIKVRLRYTKQGRMKFLSHLELMKLVERALRRKNVPLEYSNGFNPQPRLNFASPLSVGVESVYEVMEFRLKEKVNLDVFFEADFLPVGIDIIQATYSESKNPLMKIICGTEYKLQLEDESNPLLLRKTIQPSDIEKFMSQEEMIYLKRTKKGRKKEVNILRFIDKMAYNEDESAIILKIKSTEEGSVKPMIVLQMFLEFIEKSEEVNLTYTRIKIYFDEGDLFA